MSRPIGLVIGPLLRLEIDDIASRLEMTPEALRVLIALCTWTEEQVAHLEEEKDR